jgi:hypothetical protein
VSTLAARGDVLPRRLLSPIWFIAFHFPPMHRPEGASTAGAIPCLYARHPLFHSVSEHCQSEHGVERLHGKLRTLRSR